MTTKGVIVTAPVPTLDDTARLFGISPARRKVLDEMIEAAVPAHGRRASAARRTSPPRALKKAASRKSARRGGRA